MNPDLGAPLLEVERTEPFHELLLTLAAAVDIREALQRLSETAGRIVPHDEIRLMLLNETGGYDRYPSPDTAEPIDYKEDALPAGTMEPALLLTERDRSRGFRAGLRIPVLIENRPTGLLVLLSRQTDAYSERELMQAVRMAEYLALALKRDRLAEQARRAAVARDRALYLEGSVELLRTISEVLDIRAVFPKVSEIVAKIIPHDHLALRFHDVTGVSVLEATSSGAIPDLLRLTIDPPVVGEQHVWVFEDLTQERLPRIREPADYQDQLLSAGLRSGLGIRTTAGEQAMGLVFWSKRAHAFSQDDVPLARLIADYIALGVAHEQLATAERHVAEARAREERLEIRVKSLSAELDHKSGWVRPIGESAEWREVLKKAAQVADTDTTVLLQGESGTGKEVVARFIHRASPRKDGPFVAINCAALPEQLLESELFGHERGAFTGAVQSKPGQLELAAGGVLFLDEVSEMSPSAQAKFLRVLQEREFQRLGGTKTLKAQVRVIAATNRDLRKEIEREEFREDLYYRLQVFDIRIPPLRDRRDDLLPMVDAFLRDIAGSLARPPAGLTPDAKAALFAHRWPGNVRELRNALERAAILAQGGLITPQHLSLETAQGAASAATPTTDLTVLERQAIEQVMRETRGNKAEAARRLGITRIQLYTRLRKHGLEETTEL
jgi:transcriptional regulator with GAF, ATPase, and Fis domain